MDNHGIGYIDSGFGGLTVVSQALKLIPNEKIYFIGDQARMPYGVRPNQEIIDFTLQMADFLVEKHNIKLLVIACNTASAQAIPYLKKELNIPIVGVIDAGAKAAVSQTKNGFIDVIATDSTVNSKAYFKKITSTSSKVNVFQRGMQDFVSLVERGDIKDPRTAKFIKDSFADWFDQVPQAKKADTLVLGCTHFPIIIDQIAQAVPENMAVVDPAEQEVLDAIDILKDNHLQADQSKTIDHQKEDVFYTTGDLHHFIDFAKGWLKRDRLNAYELKINQKGLYL
ncbi:glutamate racemase [Oenococcus alcoholitolerans]|uniref:Glutamate racemase n=1 Tax=Oenococcus alcoholitolerans TaxID=931074 RepID=A0ABR4XRP6_9LACO|nr:glutamate racemase [Oenococcus alcoholitolerans]